METTSGDEQPHSKSRESEKVVIVYGKFADIQAFPITPYIVEILTNPLVLACEIQANDSGVYKART